MTERVGPRCSASMEMEEERPPVKGGASRRLSSNQLKGDAHQASLKETLVSGPRPRLKPCQVPRSLCAAPRKRRFIASGLGKVAGSRCRAEQAGLAAAVLPRALPALCTAPAFAGSCGLRREDGGDAPSGAAGARHCRKHRRAKLLINAR